MTAFMIVGLAVTIVGCVSPVSIGAGETNALVSRSAHGWTLRPGPPEQGWTFPTTIVVNPKGKEVNIGTTQYPDIVPATLWIVEVEELHARFLFIRIPPAASAAVDMPVLYVDQHDVPRVAGSIQQRFEFTICPEDSWGYEPKILWDGEYRLRDILFEDSDQDGIPELVERDFAKESGTVTYYEFNMSKTFSPLWKEEWTHEDNSFIRISRTRVKEQDSQQAPGTLR